MGRSLIATIHHNNDQEELISGRNILLPERSGGELSTEAKRPGAKRFEAKRPRGKIASGANDLGRNDWDLRPQDSNMFYPLQSQFKANA